MLRGVAHLEVRQQRHLRHVGDSVGHVVGLDGEALDAVPALAMHTLDPQVADTLHLQGGKGGGGRKGYGVKGRVEKRQQSSPPQAEAQAREGGVGFFSYQTPLVPPRLPTPESQ